MISFAPVGMGLILVNLLAFGAAPPAAPVTSLGCAAGTSIVASPSPGKVSNQLLGVVSISASEAWAVGGASTAVGNPPTLESAPLIVRWNGSLWRSLHAPLSAGSLSAVAASSAHDIWAVGHQGTIDTGTPLVMHWDGSAWAVVPSPAVPQGYLLGVSAHGLKDAWAVGIRLGVVSYSLIEHWDGSRWRLVKSPNPGVDYNEIDSVVSISPTRAWAVGFSQSNNVSTPMLARWDGVRWTVAKNPSTGLANNVVRSVAAQSANDVWAVGQSTSADGSLIQTLVEHWDGHRWSVVGSPSPTAQAWLTGVSVVRDKVWAVGVQVEGFTNRTLMEIGAAGRFTVIASPNRGTGDNRLEGVAAAPNGSAWAVGSDQGQTMGQTLVLAACKRAVRSPARELFR